MPGNPFQRMHGEPMLPDSRIQTTTTPEVRHSTAVAIKPSFR